MISVQSIPISCNQKQSHKTQPLLVNQRPFLRCVQSSPFFPLFRWIFSHGTRQSTGLEKVWELWRGGAAEWERFPPPDCSMSCVTWQTCSWWLHSSCLGARPEREEGTVTVSVLVTKQAVSQDPRMPGAVQKNHYF